MDAARTSERSVQPVKVDLSRLYQVLEPIATHCSDAHRNLLQVFLAALCGDGDFLQHETIVLGAAPNLFL